MRVQIPNDRENAPDRDRVIGTIADGQYGVVAREQLRAQGVSRQAIGRSLKAGRLRPLFPGVYAVGHTALSREGWWQAALLCCGENSALSHHTAATVWDLRPIDTLPVHVITTTDRGRDLDGIYPHRQRLHPSEMQLINGLRVTTPARTIADLAGILNAPTLRSTVERAQDRRRFHPTEIRATLGRSPKQKGARSLGDLLDMLEPDRHKARSHLERLFLGIVRRAKLPRPEVNYEIAARKRDFVWADQRLVVETDGYRYHSTKQAQRRDRKRDRELTAIGWRPVRFTYEEIALEPADVAGELRSLLIS